MIGRVNVKITNINTKLSYIFTLNRNITVIEGSSATGKTVLWDLVRASMDKTLSGFIRVECDYPCITFAKDEYRWFDRIKETENSVIFFDENANYVKSKEFAKAIQNTSNYYVIANREGLSNLPYSVDEIYKLKESGKYCNFEGVVNEFERIYSNSSSKYKVDRMITEDENSGYQFFNKVYKFKKCDSMGGNGNIKNLKLNPHEKTGIFIDGAAFGAHISNLEKLVKGFKNVKVFMPESFEYILLSSGIFRKHNNYLGKILKEPSEYIDSKEFISWERYFTNQIERISAEYTGAKYCKSVLSDYYYKDTDNVRLIKEKIPVVENTNLNKMFIETTTLNQKGD